MPWCRPIRQPVFNDQPHCQVDNSAGIVATGIGQIAEVGIEVFIALGAFFYMFGINYKFKKSDSDSYYSRDRYGKGIQPEDCRDQLREWAQYLAEIEVEKTPEGKKVKELKLYKQSAINSVFECGVPEQLNIVLEKVLDGVGIVWNKTKALQLENKQYN